MKLKKAIEILTTYVKADEAVDTAELEEAAQLGIEALKLVLKCRHMPNSWFVKELPGETKE